MFQGLLSAAQEAKKAFDSFKQGKTINNAWNQLKQKADQFLPQFKEPLQIPQPSQAVWNDLKQRANNFLPQLAKPAIQTFYNVSNTLGKAESAVGKRVYEGFANSDLAKNSQKSFDLDKQYAQGKISKNEYINKSMDSTIPLALSFTGSGATSKIKKIVSGAEQATKKLPGIMYSTSKKVAEGAKGAKTKLPWETPGFLKKNPDFNKTVELPTDKSAVYGANIKGGGFTGNLDPKVKLNFANWVNQRNASKIEAVAKRPEFSNLDNQGMEGIFKFQLGSKKGEYANVKRYFDTKYQELQREGIKFGFKSDYLPQIWGNSQQEIEQVFGKRLGLKPSFTIKSVIDDYKEGIAKGLTPKFNKISDLVVFYERKANKAIADRNFFNYLSNEGLIQPGSKSPGDWLSLDPDRFPKVKVKLPDKSEYVGTFKAPKPVADLINNYLKEPEGNLASVANFVSNVKNRVFSAGIPFSGWNFHGLNILTRNTLAKNNPVTGFLKGAYYLTNPKAAENFVLKNINQASQATRYGLKLGVEDFIFKIADKDVATSKLGKFEKGRLEWFDKMFSDPLFQKTIPALKIQHFKEVYDDLLKSLPKDEAGRKAAEITNSIYGGINTEQIGRSRETQNLMRSLLFAPDWLETQFKVGKGVAQSLLSPTNPAGKAYRTVARNLLGAYVTANVVNKITTGHYMFQNSAGHTFEIEMGNTPDGKTRYLRPFGTAVDFVRIPLDVALGIAQGDVTQALRAVRNRLSTPVGTAIGLLSNVDWRGRPIYGKDKYGNEIGTVQSIGGVTSQLSQNVLPTQVSSFIDFVTGRSNPEEAVSQFFELPTRYQTLAYSDKQEKLVKAYQEQGLSGQEIKSEFETTREQQKLQEGETKKNKELASRVYKSLKTINSVEERTKYLNNLKNQGVLNDTIAKEIKSLQKAGKVSKASPLVRAVSLQPNNTIKAKVITSFMKNQSQEKRVEFLTELDNAGILTADLKKKIKERSKQ